MKFAFAALSIVFAAVSCVCPKTKFIAEYGEFDFSIRYGEDYEFFYDTRKCEITASRHGEVVADRCLKLTYDELKAVYFEAVHIRIFDYPNFIGEPETSGFLRKSDKVVRDYYDYYLRFAHGARVNEIYWTDEKSDKSAHKEYLKELTENIIYMIEHNPAFEDLESELASRGD